VPYALLLLVLALTAVVAGCSAGGPSDELATGPCTSSSESPREGGSGSDVGYIPPSPNPRTALAAADPTSAATEDRPDVVFKADVESSEDIASAYGEGVQEGNGFDATVTATDAPESDGRAIRLEMPPAQGVEQDVPNRKLLDVPGFTWRSGDEYWYGIRLYFDDNWQLDEISDDRDQFTSLLSFRFTGGDLNGTGSVKIVEGDSGPCLVHTRASLSVNDYDDGAGEDPLYLGPVVKEEWIELVCHFKWSHTAENALKECWRNDQFMGRSTRRNMPADLPVAYRVGIYEGTGVDHERTLYWDDLRIGKSYESVDPTGQ
jgi:hypothetical protein